MIRRNRRVALIGASLTLAVLGGGIPSSASASSGPRVILVRSIRTTTGDENFSNVALFYGLPLTTMDLRGTRRSSGLVRVSGRNAVIGLSLATLRGGLTRRDRAALERVVRNGARLLVYEFVVSPKRTDGLGLYEAIGSVGPRAAVRRYLVSRKSPELTREFSGQTVGGTQNLSEDRTLEVRPGSAVTAEIRALGRGRRGWPVFARFAYGKGRILLSSTKQVVSVRRQGFAVAYRSSRFTQIAPTMMFMRYAGGDWAWHSADGLANLTIDDPWLTPRYGRVDFAGLLRRMRIHDFHTTIAFVPWNYDRSDPAVVSLFAKNPRYFSVAVHGNDHDPGEFSAASPQADIERDVLQARSRMQMFSRLTGLSWGRVMVFPRRLGSVRALRSLKRAGFLASANARVVPDDDVSVRQIDDTMRPAFVGAVSLPMLRRTDISGRGAVTDAVFDLFVGRPALLYAHQDFFERGIGAFDSTADRINEFAERPRWVSLEHIARRLYLQKKNDQEGVDVWMFADSAVLENVSGSSRRYDVVRMDSGNAVLGATVNGRAVRVVREGERRELTVTVPARTSRTIVMTRRLASTPQVGVSRWDSGGDVARGLFRLLSDARDLYLSLGLAGAVRSLPFKCWLLLMAMAMVSAGLAWMVLRRGRTQ